MKITEVEYQQVKSIGQYETCRATVKVLLEDGESADKAFEVAKGCVRRQLGMQEKQKEDEKEKNRQKEAMNGPTLKTDIYGYPLTVKALKAERPAPPTFREIVEAEAQARIAREVAEPPREVTFRTVMDGQPIITRAAAAENLWHLEHRQQDILDRHFRAVPLAAGGGGVGIDVGAIQIGETTQGFGNVAEMIRVDAARMTTENTNAPL